jgi:hypothetical protein
MKEEDMNETWERYKMYMKFYYENLKVGGFLRDVRLDG